MAVSKQGRVSATVSFWKRQIAWLRSGARTLHAALDEPMKAVWHQKKIALGLAQILPDLDPIVKAGAFVQDLAVVQAA
jgi:hypothetical protein